MTIDHLGLHPQWLEMFAAHCGREWSHLYPEWNVDTSRGEFLASRTDGRLPASLVAIEGDSPLGTISVIYHDLPGVHWHEPWVGSLFVLPEARRRGVGTFLVRSAEDLLRSNGIRHARLFTESSGPLFEALGWARVRDAHCNGHPVTIYERFFDVP